VSTAKPFKLNTKGFVQLRNSPEVVAEITKRASAIATAAGEGFEVLPPETNTTTPRGRARVAVYTRTFPARYAEATDRALTKALEAGKG